ncbi:unnamed protein product [Cyprideis torosa]|uniref:Uncharacterized protein n=1 Tax=Cyprideis torosa TaxID=163714 RepID=A0A7R8WDT9_9CRUS|nr:unnamed protein product [Cyprideis torosa]CAG0889467.1 unnamed protein product [Cyprideis torosa]
MDGPHKKKENNSPLSYRLRGYRLTSGAGGLKQMHVRVQESDLHIQADRDVSRRAYELVEQARAHLLAYAGKQPDFFSALSPLPCDDSAPEFIQRMQKAARLIGVGPMAAVAGALAEYVGRQLLEEGVREIVVENGGDIFLYRPTVSRVAIFAGTSSLSHRVGIEVPGGRHTGVCTSSGTVGHSLSMGDADAVTVVADCTSLADAAATRLGNEPLSMVLDERIQIFTPVLEFRHICSVQYVVFEDGVHGALGRGRVFRGGAGPQSVLQSHAFEEIACRLVPGGKAV